MVKKLIVLVTLVFLAGCAQTKFNIRSNADGTVPTYDRAQSYFISGLGQQKNIDPAEICGGADKVERVETQTTFINGLVAVVTVGIYTPQQARVYCR